MPKLETLLGHVSAAAITILLTGNANAARIEVTTPSGLETALRNVGPDDDIRIMNSGEATYPGSYTLSTSGTTADRIWISAENPQKPVFTGTLTINASNVLVTGHLFRGGGLVINGDNVNVKRNKFDWRAVSGRYNGTMLRILDSDAGVKIDRNEFVAENIIARGSLAGIGLTVAEDGNTARNVEVERNYFHDFPFKPSQYDDFAVSGIGAGAEPADAGSNVGHYIHRNLFVNMGDAEGASIKSRGNRFEFNTLIGDKTQIRVRQGGQTTIIANWCENIRDVPIGGDGNVLRWNKLVGTTQAFRLWAGEEEAGSTSGSGIVQAKNTLMVGNEGPLIVGDFFSTRPRQTIPAENTTIRGHVGPITKKRHRNTSANNPLLASDQRQTPVKLTPADVGLNYPN